MKTRPLFYHILIPFLALSLMAIAAVTLVAVRGLRTHYLETIEADLKARAELIKPHLLAQDNNALIQEQCLALGKASGMRITVIAADGWVIGDSNFEPAEMDNHASRPEVATARRQGTGTEIRFSDTLEKSMMYLAMRVDAQTATEIGWLRMSLPLDEIDTALARLIRRIGGSAVLLALLATAISIFVTRRITQPIERMTGQAQRVAEGDFSQKLSVPDSRELAQLARTLNNMSGRLSDTIGSLTAHREQLQKVFSSMVEGVLVLDPDGLIKDINHAAERLLHLQGDQVRGQAVREVLRNPELIGFIDRLPSSDTPVEKSLVIHGEPDIHLRAYGSRLQEPEQVCLGSLVVLYDVTRLKRLEAVRSEFVANVSHELKTPTTSIIGFVETLEDGAVENPEDRRRFLKIIRRQAQRLNAIVEDLLSLARIEREYQVEEVERTLVPVAQLIDEVVLECRPLADQERISLVVDCPLELEASMQREMMEQALLNLVNNAIKYSGRDSEVRIEAVQQGAGCVIRVRDFGPGIPAEHLPRLFERFYRVDKARSRAAGGTGLGLAIVKHIAQAHGGQATVESTVGKGSCFSIHLP